MTSSPTKFHLEGASTHSRDRHPRLVPRYTAVSQANTVRHSLQVPGTCTAFRDIHYYLSVTIFRPSYGFGHWNPVPNPPTYLLRKSLTLEHSAVRTRHIDSEPLYFPKYPLSIKKGSIHHLPDQNWEGDFSIKKLKFRKPNTKLIIWNPRKSSSKTQRGRR